MPENHSKTLKSTWIQPSSNRDQNQYKINVLLFGAEDAPNKGATIFMLFYLYSFFSQMIDDVFLTYNFHLQFFQEEIWVKMLTQLKWLNSTTRWLRWWTPEFYIKWVSHWIYGSAKCIWGSAVECLTRDWGAAAQASPAILRCGPWARHIYPSLVLVQPMKTRPCLT